MLFATVPVPSLPRVGAQNWPVILHTETFLEVFDPSQIIMLSPGEFTLSAVVAWLLMASVD